MNSAQRIVERFGGQSALAKLLGKGQSTVYHWTKSGVIPQKWHAQILEAAKSEGVPLVPGDFVPADVITPEPATVSSTIPVAKWWGDLSLSGDTSLPCYVLNDGRRVISRTGATTILTGGKGGGNLDSYLNVNALKPYLPTDLPDQLIEFVIENVVNKSVHGMAAETFLEICRAYAKARDSGAALTTRQSEIAVQANMVLISSAKVGLIAMIDEATGYQYARADDALQLKYKIFLEEEMRKWEPTFPNELWIEFGRLTNWRGGIHQRPRYWGKLVMELIYGYLDADVADWLRKNAPPPRRGQNYHQWLTANYGLKKLVEHIWMVVGMARACYTMAELRQKMGEQFGRQHVQFNLFLPPPT